MQLYKKKHLTIVIESPAVDRLLRKLDELEVPGYTAQPALAGRGASGSWRRDGLVGGAGVMTLVSLVLDEARLNDVLEAVFKIVERQIGIVTVMDVEVVRPDRF